MFKMTENKTEKTDRENSFGSAVWKIALPVTLQSLLQSSFSVVDQVMIGQLGSGSIAGIGLGGKFASLYSVVLAAIASAAGIMIAQYIGKEDERSVAKSLRISVVFSIGLALLFLVPCLLFPERIMALYTNDAATRLLAVRYIRIFALSFLPMAVSSVLTTLLRCREAASLPLYAGIFALILNTGLNYLLIFGKWIFPAMGVEGAAWASAVSQFAFCIAIFVFFISYQRKYKIEKTTAIPDERTAENVEMYGSRPKESCLRQYLIILGPLFFCEFLWSLGENVYTAIYGKMGTDPCAAMTLTVPIQTILIGTLSGLSQAAGILIGKFLGAEEYEQAYANSKKLMWYGLAASITLSLMLLVISPLYVTLYRVEAPVQEITRHLLTMIALIAPVKVLNMILGGGILRSGGKTQYVMWIDMIGTWVFGVPFGLTAAFIWNLSIPWVYFLLSLEECIRLGISLILFRKKTWMESIR